MGRGGRIAVGSVVAGLLLLGALALAGLGIGFVVVERTFDAEAVRVRAPVVETDPGSGTITVEIAVSGRPYRAEVAWFDSTLPEVGSYAEVEYVQGDPTTVRPAGSNAIGTTGWVLTGLSALPVLVAVAVGIGTVFWARAAGRTRVLNPFAPLPLPATPLPLRPPPPPPLRPPPPPPPPPSPPAPPWGRR